MVYTDDIQSDWRNESLKFIFQRYFLKSNLVDLRDRTDAFEQPIPSPSVACDVHCAVIQIQSLGEYTRWEWNPNPAMFSKRWLVRAGPEQKTRPNESICRENITVIQISFSVKQSASTQFWRPIPTEKRSTPISSQTVDCEEKYKEVKGLQRHMRCLVSGEKQRQISLCFDRNKRVNRV